MRYLLQCLQFGLRFAYINSKEKKKAGGDPKNSYQDCLKGVPEERQTYAGAAEAVPAQMKGLALAARTARGESLV